MINFTKQFFYPNISLHDYPILSRYPNPHSSHVIASDTVKAYTTTINGKISMIVEKLHTKTSKISVPFLINSRKAFILEVITIDEDKISAHNMNISHKKFMTMVEHQTIENTTQFNKKIGENVAGVVVHIDTNIHSWNSYIEQFCLTTYKENVKKAQRGMRHVMENLGWKI
eukprot:NODE_285_length_10753_cov_0.438615.p6 type:complete len:171 gc:universal NODE_285_length_10753_cov_0.438615:10489-9977(-)